MKTLPKYLSIIFCVVFTSSVRSQSWNKNVFVAGDGVSEVGKYIDFHEADVDPGVDFNVRLYASGGRLYTYHSFITTRLGIGVESPQYSIDIDNADYGAKQIRWRAASGQYGYTYSDSGGSGIADSDPYSELIFLSPGNKSISFYTNSSQKAILDINGNLGLGVANPAAKLDIFGNSSVTTNLILSANYDNKYRWRFNTIDRTQAIDLDITASGSDDSQDTLIMLSPSWSGRPEFRFKKDWFVINNGRVGIGTTTPSEVLSVNGTIRSKEVKVEAAPWPDYVFSPDYTLPTLEETKAYIEANKHLPEIPSAKEMEENGVALGEMNMLLLKKIEELTLYIIDLETRVKTIEDEK